MIFEICDIWDKYDAAWDICIPVNGYVMKSGRLVMGRGVAQQARERFHFLDELIGGKFYRVGYYVMKVAPHIFVFPVKPVIGQVGLGKYNVLPRYRARYKEFDTIPGWAMMADLQLISHSLYQLRRLHDAGTFDRIYLPKPGCGNGGLKWEVVEPYCLQYGDWLVVVDRR